MKDSKGLEMAKGRLTPLNKKDVDNMAFNTLVLQQQQAYNVAQKALKFIKVDESGQTITPSWWTVFANWKTLLEIVLEIIRIFA